MFINQKNCKMDILEAIESRKSVRTFSGKPLSAHQVTDINEAIAMAVSPFPGDCTIQLAQVAAEGDFKPGTYGVIKDAKAYLLLGIGEGVASAVTAGFKMEQVVLSATELGLGTCWIAATFKGSDFEKAASFPEGQSLKIVSPIGEPAGRQHFLEKFTRFTLGSKNRKPFDTLFFVGDWKTPADDSDMFYESLQMLRLAPSSTNSQPWRVLIKGETVYFYYKSRGTVSLVDMGIGMCHFALTEAYRGYQGIWGLAPDVADHPRAADGLTFLASYTRK